MRSIVSAPRAVAARAPCPAASRADGVGRERAVSRVVPRKIAFRTVGDLHAESRGHGRRLDRTEPPAPNDFALEPHASIRTRWNELDPDILVSIERREASHVETPAADVVRTTER